MDCPLKNTKSVIDVIFSHARTPRRRTILETMCVLYAAGRSETCMSCADMSKRIRGPSLSPVSIVNTARAGTTLLSAICIANIPALSAMRIGIINIAGRSTMMKCFWMFWIPGLWIIRIGIRKGFILAQIKFECISSQNCQVCW